jgi:hypothetical protein
MKETDENTTPSIIEEINKRLSQNPPQDLDGVSVEGLAVKLGINNNILYDWVKTDAEFSRGLEGIKSSQEDSPFRTGTEDDTYVDAMMIAFLLLETRDRHFKAKDN